MMALSEVDGFHHLKLVNFSADGFLQAVVCIFRSFRNSVGGERMVSRAKYCLHQKGWIDCSRWSHIFLPPLKPCPLLDTCVVASGPDPKSSSSWKSMPHVRREDAKAFPQEVLRYSGPLQFQPNLIPKGGSDATKGLGPISHHPYLQTICPFYPFSSCKWLSIWGSYFSETFETVRT